MEPEKPGAFLRHSDQRLIRQASISFMLITFLGLGILVLYLSLNSRPTQTLGTSIQTQP
jgi:hypothetical protein